MRVYRVRFTDGFELDQYAEDAHDAANKCQRRHVANIARIRDRDSGTTVWPPHPSVLARRYDWLTPEQMYAKPETAANA